jgi:probable rRNA maturation factor
MSPVVFVADEQDEHKVETATWLKLANDVLTAENVGDTVEVSVMYVDERTIADLNERFMGKSGPTDVLSFPIDEGPPESGRVPDSGGNGPGYEPPGDNSDEVLSLLGDVVVCPSVAKKNAPDHAGTYEDELALLLVHGLLHLLGMDHIETEEAESMEKRERELLREFWKELPETAWPGRDSSEAE